MQTKRILLALAGSASDTDLIRHTAAIAKANKAQVVAVHVIEVRWNLPLDAVLEPELERERALFREAVRFSNEVAARCDELGRELEAEAKSLRARLDALEERLGGRERSGGG